MEENKVQETSTEETKHEAEESNVEEKQQPFLEPRPYKRKSEAEIDETATVQSKDTEEADETQEATPENVERPASVEDKVYKKRYDDLKRHYDSTVNKHKDEVFNLKTQVEQASKNFIPPKDKDALDKWRKEYPDVYDVIKTVAYQEADEKAKEVNNKLQQLQKDQQKVLRDKAEVELLKLHPDFNKIKDSQDFHDWAGAQDSMIQGWLYDNFDNANLAARAIDLYKMDKGLKKAEADKVDTKKEASKSVTSTARSTEKDIKGKKIWSVSEIKRLKPSEFVKFEKDIDMARKEGRIRN